MPGTHRLSRNLVAVAALALLAAALLAQAANALPPTGVMGKVTNGSSVAPEPIEKAQVCAYPVHGSGGECSSSFSGGQYTLELAEEEYRVVFTGRVCTETTSEFVCKNIYVEQEKTAKVTTGSMTKVDFALLEVDGKISGHVTAGGTPLAGAQVCAFGAGFGCAAANAGGEYTIEHLPPGSYKVEFSPGEMCKAICQPASNYLAQYWNNQPGVETATAVTVKTSETFIGINAELQAGGHISGRVTNASIYTQPIASDVVCANPVATNKEGAREGEAICALTSSSGEYTISALRSGGYEVEFRGEVCVEEKGAAKCTHPFINQYYQSIVSVAAPRTTSGINGSLFEASPAKPANTGAPTVTVGQTPRAGTETLTCSTGSWSNNPTSLSYRWLRNGSAIAGQTANAYVAQSADADTGIACEVTASNGAGAVASKSNTVQIPKPAPGVAVFKSAAVKDGTASIELLCTGASACSGTVKIIERVTSAHGKHKKMTGLTIGSVRFSMALGKTATVKVHLTAKGSKLLSQAGKKGLKVQITGSGVQAHSALLRAASKHH